MGLRGQQFAGFDGVQEFAEIAVRRLASGDVCRQVPAVEVLRAGNLPGTDREVEFQPRRFQGQDGAAGQERAGVVALVEKPQLAVKCGREYPAGMGGDAFQRHEQLADDGRFVNGGQPLTCLVVSHRRAALERADHIIVLKDGRVDAESRIEGKVVVEAGAVIERSVVRGPAIIGARARLSQAYVGPFTSIMNDVEVRDAEIEHSIVLEGSAVVDLQNRVEDSLIGKNVRIYREPVKPSAYRFMLGDNSEVGIRW